MAKRLKYSTVMPAAAPTSASMSEKPMDRLSHPATTGRHPIRNARRSPTAAITARPASRKDATVTRRMARAPDRSSPSKASW